MGISIRAFILVLLVCVFPTLTLSEEIVTNKAGNLILLKDDHTWELVSSPPKDKTKQNKVASTDTNIYEIFQLGKNAYKEKDHDKALRILKPLAVKGHGNSQYHVAVIYYDGPAKTGPAQDFKKAKKWFKKLAENVNAEPSDRGLAYDYIAGMYWFGEGVPKNSNLQIKWLKKGLKALAAHKTVHKQLMYNLGSAHNHAAGEVKAYMWFTLSEHYYLRNIVAKDNNMTPAQIALAKKLAAECVAKKYKGC